MHCIGVCESLHHAKYAVAEATNSVHVMGGWLSCAVWEEESTSGRGDRTVVFSDQEVVLLPISCWISTSDRYG